VARRDELTPAPVSQLVPELPLEVLVRRREAGQVVDARQILNAAPDDVV
jgi:hypothetical protein